LNLERHPHAAHIPAPTRTGIPGHRKDGMASLTLTRNGGARAARGINAYGRKTQLPTDGTNPPPHATVKKVRLDSLGRYLTVSPSNVSEGRSLADTPISGVKTNTEVPFVIS